MHLNSKSSKKLCSLLKNNLTLFLHPARDKNDKKLFAFAFVRLQDVSGATLPDGPHELYIYKCEERAKLDPANYLVLPSNAREPTYSGNIKASTKFNQLKVTKLRGQNNIFFLSLQEVPRSQDRQRRWCLYTVYCVAQS